MLWFWRHYVRRRGILTAALLAISATTWYNFLFVFFFFFFFISFFFVLVSLVDPYVRPTYTLHVARSNPSSSDSPFSPTILPHSVQPSSSRPYPPPLHFKTHHPTTQCSSLRITCEFHSTLLSFTFHDIATTFILSVTSFVYYPIALCKFSHPMSIRIYATSNLFRVPFSLRMYLHCSSVLVLPLPIFHIFLFFFRVLYTTVCHDWANFPRIFTFFFCHSCILFQFFHRSAFYMWLMHTIIQHQANLIPGMWMYSLCLLSLPANGSIMLDVQCTLKLSVSFRLVCYPLSSISLLYSSNFISTWSLTVLSISHSAPLHTTTRLAIASYQVPFSGQWTPRTVPSTSPGVSPSTVSLQTWHIGGELHDSRRSVYVVFV